MKTGEILGKYRIIKPVGEGGEGSVYLAEDMGLSRLAAVKQIREGRTENGECGKQILQEAALLRDLRHPMLPVVYDLFYDKEWYLVMEYIEGISLHNYIEKRGYAGEKRARFWAESLLDILIYLHTRKPAVIYRDLKPDNIMVCKNGNLRLVDLGAACLKSYGDSKDTRMALTTGYAPPEQQEGVNGRIYADERSDIYAFGRVLYYIVTGADPGKPPYAALSVKAYDPMLGDALERIILKCTRKDPKERYQVAEEIARDLRNTGGDERTGKRTGYRGSRDKRSGRRRDFVRHMEKRVWLTEYCAQRRCTFSNFSCIISEKQ